MSNYRVKFAALVSVTALLSLSISSVSAIAGQAQTRPGAAKKTTTAFGRARRPAHFHRRIRHHGIRRNTSLGTVLILSTSVNGGTSSAEAIAASNDGYTVTVDTSTTWAALTESAFAGYSAIVLGDPSSGGTCANSASVGIGAAQTDASAWGPAITGNVAVVGTAPVFANTAGSQKLWTMGSPTR